VSVFIFCWWRAHGLSAEPFFCAFRFCFACEIGGIINWESFSTKRGEVAIYLGEMGELRSSLKYFPRLFQLKVSAEFQASIEMHSENVKCACKSSIIEIRLCAFI
jgi:hypothetical protein